MSWLVLGVVVLALIARGFKASELARSLADADAQVLLVCSSWVPGEHKTEQWRR
ncbi:hypothetical protein [Pseudarthrobacter oxydans]|uniref:hypothetical protein n=1 Tax=Pseudarthrobacter oxydans TaxID=1671 RepID=UPI001FE6957E|nr:hypothetical protein [Pseudarthrobacter oxydans]